MVFETEIMQLANTGGLGLLIAILLYDKFVLQKKTNAILERNTQVFQLIQEKFCK